MTRLGTVRAAAITPADMAAIADELGCHPAHLEAIANVESGGFGWHRDGRMTILFEKHWFYKLVDKEKRAAAVNAGLARKRWISPAKGGYRDQNTPDRRYGLLRRAMDMDADAALQSISMGRFQIMGFNWKICGCKSVRAMWEAFLDSERNQVGALANFLVWKGLANRKGKPSALSRGDFRRIEKVYNGGGLSGVYARRMKQESDKLRAGKWKGYRPGTVGIASGAQHADQRPQPAPESGSVRPGPTVAKASETTPVVVAAPTKSGAFLGFLMKLFNRLLFYRLSSWTPSRDADERGFKDDCR